MSAGAGTQGHTGSRFGKGTGSENHTLYQVKFSVARCVAWINAARHHRRNAIGSFATSADIRPFSGFQARIPRQCGMAACNAWRLRFHAAAHYLQC
jgi:hypothetical protein